LSALRQTGCGGGGRLPCGRLVEEEVVCPAVDWLRRKINTIKELIRAL